MIVHLSKIRSVLVGLALASITSVLTLSQVFPYPQPIDPRAFSIMAWGPSPVDPDQLGLMKQAGFNVSGFCKAEDLKSVEKAGLTCFVSDPNTKGYDWTHLPSKDQIEKNATELTERIGGSRAALGFLLTDEPTAAMLPGLGEVARVLKQHMPGLWPYVNAFPFNAGRARIGAMSYADYLRAQVKQVGQPFLSYDQYALKDDAVGDAFYANLEIARRISLELKVPFWNCILATSLPGNMESSEATLSVQAYSTLAYGGRGISYFTYLRPDETNFSHTAIDGFGNRTPIWDILRRLNGEILTLAPILLRLHSTGVFHYPTAFEPDQEESLIVKDLHINSVRGSTRPNLLIGEFADDKGREYLMLVNKNLVSMLAVNLRLVDEDSKLERISPYSGQRQPFDLENGDSLPPGAGMLLAIERNPIH
jgi:hypothetical protein